MIIDKILAFSGYRCKLRGRILGFETAQVYRKSVKEKLSQNSVHVYISARAVPEKEMHG